MKAKTARVTGGNGEQGRSGKEGRRASTKSRASSKDLSGKDYAIMAAATIGIGVVLLLLFVFLAPRLIPADLLNQFFYIVLIVWGLVSALVLFGVMKSYARVTYKHLGGAIELGGPAAFAALVVVGGFWLVPRTDAFTLTLRPHGPQDPVITLGTIRVEFGSLSPAIADINSNGEAVFKGVPHKFWGSAVKVLPQVQGYGKEYQTLILNKDVLDLNLATAQTTLKGRLNPPPEKGRVTKVLIVGEEGEVVPDTYGRFQFTVHKSLGQDVRLNVCADGKRIYDDFVKLAEGEIAIPTREPDAPCGN